jgi:hypothetical protein
MKSSNQMFSDGPMSNSDAAQVPLKQIEAALRKTTEAMARELAAPTDRAPNWNDFEWCIAQSTAAMHGVTPLLASTLRWRGPERWEHFLHEQREHTFQRHHRIARLLTEIGERTTSEGIAVVPLKGAALHELGIYRPGERPMSDLDLLVKPTDVPAMLQLLDACGYREVYSTWKHRVFEPDTKVDPVGFGEHARNPIKIELHERITERIPVLDRDISDRVFPPQPAAGLNRYPSNAALMIHLLTHAASNMCFNFIRLLHLHDIALLSHRMQKSDWDGVFGAPDEPARWWVSPPLMLTARYYVSSIPADVVARAHSDCSWLLRQLGRSRTLSDVSMSNLWIQAFPGIEWSHSTSEAFRLGMSRLIPSRETLMGRKDIMKVNPGMAHFSWSHLPQWRRIVRWTLGRAPRIETLFSVQAALQSLTQRS